MRVPLWVLRVLYDTRPGHGGLGDHNGDVGVAGDDLRAAVLGLVFSAVGFGVAGVGGVGDCDSVTGGEATAEALGDKVHVGKPPGFDDMEVEVAVQVGHQLQRHFGHCDGVTWHRRREVTVRTAVQRGLGLGGLNSDKKKLGLWVWRCLRNTEEFQRPRGA